MKKTVSLVLAFVLLATLLAGCGTKAPDSSAGEKPKVVILANSIFGRNVTFHDVRITGISSITEDAVMLAAGRNMVIRLIGEVSETKLEVGPRLIPKGHPLSISGTLNTAQIDSDLAGPVTVSGRGAGRIETASAILSDLIAIMDERKKTR